MRLIGVSGLAGSGKDAVARVLCNFASFGTVSLADPMKEFCSEIFDFSDDQLWGASAMRNEVDERWGFSPREALQKLGTEWGRSLHPDVWIRAAIDRAKGELDNPFIGKVTGVVIPDVRFPNEAAAIRAAGGEVWRVTRAGLPRLTGDAGTHISEHSLTDADIYERIISNDGTIGELEERVLQAVKQ